MYRKLGQSGRAVKGVAIMKRIAGEWEKLGENIGRFVKIPCPCCQELAKAAGYTEVEIKNMFSEEAADEIKKKFQEAQRAIS